MYDSFFDSLFGYGSFGNSFSDISRVISGVGFLSVFFYIILFAVVAVIYFMRGYTLLSIGRKAGVSEEYNWMPFVPVAQAIYRYKILGESPWSLFGWSDYMFYALVIIITCIILKIPFLAVLVFAAIVYIAVGRLGFLLSWFIVMVACYTVPYAPAGWIVFSTVVFLYLAVTIAFRFVYFRKLYGAFNINPLCAVHIFIPGGTLVAVIFDYLIAFTSNYKFNRASGAGGYAPLSGYAPTSGGYAPTSGGYASQPPQSRSGSIIGVSGMYRNTGIDIPYGEEIILGRDAAMSHVIIDQDSDRVSRRHCGVRYNPADGTYIVTDYSTNGTFREDGSRLPANMPVALSRGTVIKLGSSQVSFRMG